MNLDKLLRPNSIAVVGASDKSGFGKSTCSNLLKSPLKDKIYFVNPSKKEVLGKKCYKTLEGIPGEIDLVIIILNKFLVPNILKQAHSLGCKSAVVYASGYGETGCEQDKELEKELKTLCQDLDMAVMGVNCAGFINNVDSIFAFGMIVEGEARKGNIAIVSQSGKICLNSMQIDYMKYSYLISSGNSTVINIEDYIDYLIDDENTKVIGIYFEGVKNPQKFTQALKKALEKGKPIVVLKIGKSAKGTKVASSHTGSLAGSDKTYDAIFKKFGVIRVDDIEELLQTCYLLGTINRLPDKGTFCVMSLSGGETGVCADVGSLYNINFPEFEQSTVNKLKQILPGYATINNPLDMTATLAHDKDKYAEAVKAIMEDEGIGMVLPGFSILPNHKNTDVIYPMSEGMVNAVKQGSKPLAVISFVNCSRDSILRSRLEESNIPVLPATWYGFKILKYLKDYVDYDYMKSTLDMAIPESGMREKTIALSEQDSKNELSKFGINIPKAIVVKNKTQIPSAIKDMNFPIVAKIESADILHKSDIGGVKLNINSLEELLKSYDEIMENAKYKKSEAKINGVLIQEMIPQGLEFILGVKNDPQFGPMLLCGLGGIFVEVFKDVSMYPVPLNNYEAKKMLETLNGYKLLKGYRGEEYDIDALVDLMIKVSKYAKESKESVRELDINPVFVYKKGMGVGIADALIIKNSEL